MKTCCWLTLLSVCLCLDPLLADTASGVDLIEHFNSGQINWTQGSVTANGTVSAHEADDMNLHPRGTELAFQRAVENIYNTLLQLRIDDQRCGSLLFVENRYPQSKIRAMAAASKILHMDTASSGEGTLYVQMSLYGGFSQFVLPSDIRQVQPIRPLNGAARSQDFSVRPSDIQEDSGDPEGYTGLIVDARGTGAKPSMVPLLLNESGVEVYGPAYISREYAVQNGVCQYIQTANSAWTNLPRVAPNPLVVKGLKTDPRGSCRIVISNTDASRLLGASSHLVFLKRCRVVIVLD